MPGLHPGAAVGAMLALSGCALFERGPSRPLEYVSVGARIVASGVEREGAATVRKIELRSWRPERRPEVRVTAEVRAAAPDRIDLLGYPFHLGPETRYEDEEGATVPPFVIAPGSWVRVIGVRRHDDGPTEVRAVRRRSPRRRFKVQGEILELDRDSGRLRIGALELPVAPDASVKLAVGLDPRDPLAWFQADDQKGVPLSIWLGDSVRLGGELSLRGELLDERDLDKNRTDGRGKSRVRGRLDLLWLLDDSGAYAFFEGRAGRGDLFRESGADTTRSSDEISRAYVNFRPLSFLRVQAGRHDFDEEREWLFDEVLDGVRVHVDQRPFEVEAAAGWGREFLAENNLTERTFTFVGTARYHVGRDHHVTGYVVQRTDNTQRNFEPNRFNLPLEDARS